MGSRISRAKANAGARTALEKAYSEGDNRGYREIEQSVHREKGGYTAANDSLPSALPTSTNHAQQQASVNMSNYGYQNGYPAYGGQRSQQLPPQGMFPLRPSMSERHDRMLNGQGFTFRASPFYGIISRIGGVHPCEGKVPLSTYSTSGN